MAIFTLLWALIYLPIETYGSWKVGGLVRFAYLIDVIGIGLLLAGSFAAWRAHPVACTLLAGAWAWTSANFWRGTMERFWTVAQGGTLVAGRAELWLGPILTGVAILAFIASLGLSIRESRS